MKDSFADAKRILMVEDEPAICELCQRVLTGEQLQVDVAANGELAQAMIAKERYVFLLIDIRLPIIDGKELYLWLKDEYPRLTGRVVFTTGSVIGPDTMSFLKESGRPWLPKPFTPDKLRAMVRKTITEVEK